MMEKKEYILRAQGSLLCHKDSATHPRALKFIVSQIEGMDVLDDALPNKWIISATDEAIAKLKESIQGWQVSPSTEASPPACVPPPQRGPQP